MRNPHADTPVVAAGRVGLKVPRAAIRVDKRVVLGAVHLESGRSSLRVCASTAMSWGVTVDRRRGGLPTNDTVKEGSLQHLMTMPHSSGRDTQQVLR